MGRRRVIWSSILARVATSALFVAGFGVGIGAHQALVSSGARRAVFAVVAAVSAVVLIALAVELRREKPGSHARSR